MKQSVLSSSVSLSDQSKAIILGSLLGDGSLKINERYQNARFSFRHSIHQADYFHWKVNALQEIAGESSVWVQKNDGGYSRSDKLRFQSRALPALTELYRLTHKQKRLVIRRKWLNMMTPLSLAIWWFDDGSIITNGRRGVLCTDGFDRESVKILAQYLNTVWKIKTSLGAIGRKRDGKQEKYWRLWIRSSEELKKLLRIIIPYVPVVSVLPKVMMLYRDSQLQQRWISEVAKLSSFSETVVAKAVTAKKARWKAFRE